MEYLLPDSLKIKTYVHDRAVLEKDRITQGQLQSCSSPWITVKLRAVDWSTIQFWKFFAKGFSAYATNFPFINILKMFGCATNWDMLLLATLRHMKLYFLTSLN